MILCLMVMNMHEFVYDLLYKQFFFSCVMPSTKMCAVVYSCTVSVQRDGHDS